MKILGRAAYLCLAAVLACREDAPIAGPNLLSIPPSDPTFKAVATGRGNDGNLQVILLGAVDGLPYLVWQSHSDGSWHWYGKLPNPNGVRFSSIATGSGNGGNLQVVGIGASDGRPYLLWQHHSTGTWIWYGPLPNSGPFLPNGYQFGALAGGVRDELDALYMPALGAIDGLLYLNRQEPSDGSWARFDPPGVEPLNGGVPVPLSTIASLTDPYGCGGTWPFGGCTIQVAQVFGVGRGDNLPYWAETEPRSCVRDGVLGTCYLWIWEGRLPDPGGVQFSSLAANYGNGKNSQVIGLGASDGFPYLMYQVHFSQSGERTWFWYGPLPNPNAVPFSTVAMGRGNGGNLQVIGIGASNALPYLIWQHDGTGSWAWYGPLPNPNGTRFSSAATGSGNGDNLQVVLLGESDGLPYLIWQHHSTGTWFWYGGLPHQDPPPPPPPDDPPAPECGHWEVHPVLDGDWQETGSYENVWVPEEC